VFLSPQEIDKLTLHQAGFLAQKRLARGTRLNHPEAVALIATQLLELIRDGRSVAALMEGVLLSFVPGGAQAVWDRTWDGPWDCEVAWSGISFRKIII
jgi:hypothetical protein